MSIITVLFEHQLTMKMYHFQTERYGAHKAADAYLIKYTANLDQFMEVFQGEHGTIKDQQINVVFKVVNDQTVDGHLERMAKFLDEIGNLSNALKAIRDVMTADIQQLRYLLTFN